MRLLVTGRTGQVATALAEIAPRARVDLVAVGRPDLDLADPASVRRVVRDVRPVAVISAAAWTAVDAAEEDEAAAFAVNAEGPGHLAAAAAAVGAAVVHLSTDYVFSGSAGRPRREDDPPAPLSAYGRGKLEGERRVLAAQPDAAVLRTSWVYAAQGANFVRTMLRLGAAGAPVRVVADQVGAPTAAEDVALGCLAVADALLARPGDPALRGVFHMTAAGEATWADLAEAVFEGSARRGGPSVPVIRVATAEFARPAPRPADSRLDCGRLAAAHGIALPPWRRSLERVLDRILGPVRPGTETSA